MPNERAILCGDVPDTAVPFGGNRQLRLRLWGPEHEITLCIDDICRRMSQSIPSPFVDLIEIATYIYCADQATKRGGNDVESMGQNWRRRLFVRIPVRNPDLWRSPAAISSLTDTLSFLSDDEYHFEFVPLVNGPQLNNYLRLRADDTLFDIPQEVVLYSGGLDSVAGALQEAVLDRRPVVLVTHKSTDKLVSRHRILDELLLGRVHAVGGKPPLHVQVEINKAKRFSREYTQRSRSFLYASLAAAIAQMSGLSRIRFFENGIVSFNLPLATQVVGAKATRTTHPQVLKGFQRIFSVVAGRPFGVENAFLWKTKTEVLQKIAEAEGNALIRHSTSCTHTWEMTLKHTHCGSCSQCIDRRFAVLAAGLEADDPGDAYGIDLLTGERDGNEDRTMLASYVETASRVARMSAIDFFSKYGEASRLLSHLDGTPDEAALKVHQLHRRHAAAVTGVVDAALAKHAQAIRQRTLPADCLLRLVCDTSPASVPAAPDTERNGSEYYFIRKGQVWAYRFAGGDEQILLPSRGAAYLHTLLANARTAFTIADLILRVVRGQNEHGVGDAGEVTEEDALAAYRVSFQELQETLRIAIRDHDAAAEAKAKHEMTMLADQIKQSRGIRGDIRKAADDREKLRKSFQAAMRRLREQIAKFDKKFADHLKPPYLKCGTNPCYAPDPGVDWET